MTTRRSVKARTATVAVIASRQDLRRALKLRRAPDLFELRLDALHRFLSEVDSAIESLPAPFIVTARHPLEGGMANLSAAQRRDLLLRFLPRAAYIDVELRSAAQLRPVLQAAENRPLKRILSVHELRRTPTVDQMAKLARAAKAFSADIFKIAVRTDTPEAVGRLLEFFDLCHEQIAISAMGIGKFGRLARLSLARRGSVLNYAHLGTAEAQGQFSLQELRRRFDQ